MTETALSDSDVLYDDEALLVVNKPAGLLSQADHTGDVDLVTAAKRWLRDARDAGSDPFVGLVHRLDRPASGVMVLARTSDAARDLSNQFQDRLVEKRYLAIVEGRMTGMGTCTDYIAKIDREPTLVGPDHPEGKRAILRWQTLAPGDSVSVVQVQLETGRPHQIRLQLSNEGHPILGDFRHGGSRELDGKNLALHQVLLRVEHPDTYRMMTWAVSPPASWNHVLSSDQAAAIRAAVQRR
ncbi:RNA pseudouridine synthase [Longibacter salinarum]|uniref:RNA pseudouridine synthase n=1 Tax=Longibacter salinarum TaxID=1850348 RepID=A0A2A8CZH3_9BACT|nr:RluA family pseudouridine synthase [Longibacter salinarum]PEN13977.1 RNA pseudouridine synthase [Longibacter salinarum]